MNLTTAIFGSSFQSILEWVVDQDEEITVERVEEEHGGELGMAGLDDKGDQLFRLLSSLTTHESEDLVINAKNGYEAWRRLNRRCKGNGKDSKGKGKGSGSGSSGSAGACFNCGKTGHRAAECWSKKKGGKGSKGSGKSGSKQKHVAGFEDADYEAGDQEEQPEAEVGMFELGAFTQGESPKDPSWVRFNLDTGAAIPVDWKDRIPTKEGAQMMFKTASGELVPGTGTGTFQGKSETGSRCRVTGPLAPVHKPLVSAYKCLKHGRMAVLDQDGGQLIPVDSATGRKFSSCSTSPVKPKRKLGCPYTKRKEFTTSI